MFSDLYKKKLLLTIQWHWIISTHVEEYYSASFFGETLDELINAVIAIS